MPWETGNIKTDRTRNVVGIRITYWADHVNSEQMQFARKKCFKNEIVEILQKTFACFICKTKIAFRGRKVEKRKHYLWCCELLFDLKA